VVEFEQILCASDLSEASRPAVTYAAAFARWYTAQLTVLHVVPGFDPIQVPADRIGGDEPIVFPPSRDEVEVSARQLTADVLTGVDAQVAVEEGDAAAVILERALSMPADLLVMGTHGRSNLERLLFGSITDEVMRVAPCPVLTVPPHAPAADATNSAGFTRILCALDFSPASLQALGFAVDLARHAGGTVTVLHVIEWLAEHEPRTASTFDVDAYRVHLVDEASGRIRDVLPAAAADCVIDEVVGAGRAHREVLRVAAERSADVIVMGTQGIGGIGHALFGSTSQQVVRGATCPILFARGAGSAS
jgi:nucleotide-binding universal stress UspA family protein